MFHTSQAEVFLFIAGTELLEYIYEVESLSTKNSFTSVGNGGIRHDGVSIWDRARQDRTSRDYAVFLCSLSVYSYNHSTVCAFFATCIVAAGGAKELASLVFVDCGLFTGNGHRFGFTRSASLEGYADIYRLNRLGNILCL